ncbi:polysaccharide biosynthesis/export family protein [uncultured Alistipes sp.]|jgi:periplasmic protein involved in polysaccharide export|uniref:polysaccharide biosynthesis/export family protein n=1 Tax=uncultured Alistipes sp. TaxID=538949 RepID=UPI0025D509D4|nr:polysaccharide biosynthesis/export family protein [uncultured Alistipes sp.]
MKHLRLLFPVVLTAILLSSCAAQKRAWYLQDAQPFTPEQIAMNGQIRIKPLDRLTIVVNSRDPELAVPFNSYSSLSSLTGTIAYGGASTNQSLQIRTVDENGMLDMPVIGKVECKGKTRSELAQAIANKIIEGGYINDPTINVQFADMKISVIGEVVRPGQYDVTRDKISIFDALAMAGDLTIYGIRADVAVAREVNGIRTIEYLDLTSKEIFNSPAFYIQQNDVIYVKPNKYKAQTGEISQNRSFYISLASTAISVATLIVTLTK